MKRLECKKDFRCTYDEAKQIAAQAEKMKISESQYMRYKILEKGKRRIPPEIEELLQELKFYDLKIGTNINQIVRSCNSKKFITKKDYEMLLENLTALNDKYSQIIQLLKEALMCGDHQAAED